MTQISVLIPLTRYNVFMIRHPVGISLIPAAAGFSLIVLMKEAHETRFGLQARLSILQ